MQGSACESLLMLSFGTVAESEPRVTHGRGNVNMPIVAAILLESWQAETLAGGAENLVTFYGS